MAQKNMRHIAYNKYDIDVLCWLIFSPLGYCFTVRRARKEPNLYCGHSFAEKVYLIGTSIFWLMLIFLHQFSLFGLLITNLTNFFIFFHTVGFYEKYSTSVDQSESRYDIQMLLFHLAAIIGFALVTTKFGRMAACDVGSFLNIETAACNEYNQSLLWIGIAIYASTLAIAQLRGLFRIPSIKIEHELSRDSPYRSNHEFSYVIYLLIVLAIGLFW